MAELILTQAGARWGGQILGSIGARLGRAVGKEIGRRIDKAVFGQPVRVVGPRMQELQVQGSTEGAGIALVFGRMRIAGELIWASRFKETRAKRKASKASNQRIEERRYSVSLAIGLCEGEVARIERVWANGKQFDLSSVNWRLHKGSETQAPDALIEAIEGHGVAPAYRGLAYVVFEDLPLDEFGATIPQFAFEVVRGPRAPAADALEMSARGVCLVPGSGEFALATTPVRRVLGPGREAHENTHARAGDADLSVALDQLQSDLPHCESVLIVSSWFGDDLRCGSCAIRPGVEQSDKATRPVIWSVQGLSRTQAMLVSRINDAPAFGGTPSDASVREAITAVRARGLRVGLYPFILMDIPADNTKPDPYGGAKQAAYPWRGRITPHPGVGQAGSVDKTSAVAGQIASFFGAAAPAHFSVVSGSIAYTGPNEWSFRRFILHHAKLAALAGGVDLFVIGSELRALTTARSSASTFPAVDALCALAADVRTIVGGSTKLTYAADWSEYFGYQPQDGSGDVYFHLDPLWAHAAIDGVGIDWYPPLTDWRDGAHLDAQGAPSIDDAAYLRSRIEGGEGYDWFYASTNARTAQTRTPITDGAYNKSWVFRPKDLRNWWSHAHYNRPGGVQAATPTAWVPQSKPIWLIEFGCPAVDKGANTPNLFFDAKSAESALPAFSSGVRDDMIQRRVLEAYLNYWAPNEGRNPVSTVYGGPMVDLTFAHIWAYDARPYPAFPALRAVWGDSDNWRSGHWLNGRIGANPLAGVLKELCERAGIPSQRLELTGARGVVTGFAVEAPAAMSDAIETLLAAYAIDMIEGEGKVVALPHARAPVMAIDPDLLIKPEMIRLDGADSAGSVRLRYIDAASDYRFAVTGSRRDDGGARTHVLDLPLALDEAQAETVARRARLAMEAARTRLEATLAPPLWVLQPGDIVTIGDSAERWQLDVIRDERAQFVRVPALSPGLLSGASPGADAVPAPDPTPWLSVFSTPPLLGAEQDDRPLAAVFASPWRGAYTSYAGPDRDRVRAVGVADQPAIAGVLEWALWPGPIGRWDEGNVFRVRLFEGALESVDARAALDGANLFAVLTSSGGLELLHARRCVLMEGGVWEMSGLLRGVQGTACANPAPVGSTLIKIDPALARLDLSVDERRVAQTFVAPRLGEAASAPDSAVLIATVDDLWARPFAPCHVRGARAANGDVTVRWVRRARLGGDSWAGLEVPLGEDGEAYRVEIMAGGVVKRTLTADAPFVIYPQSAQNADFGAAPSSLTVRVAQLSQRYGYGQVRESILWL